MNMSCRTCHAVARSLGPQGVAMGVNRRGDWLFTARLMQVFMGNGKVGVAFEIALGHAQADVAGYSAALRATMPSA